MSDVETVIIQDVSSGKAHLRFRKLGSAELISFEADNLDQAGAYRIITEEILADLPHDARCKRCWKEEDDVERI